MSASEATFVVFPVTLARSNVVVTFFHPYSLDRFSKSGRSMPSRTIFPSEADGSKGFKPVFEALHAGFGPREIAWFLCLSEGKVIKLANLYTQGSLSEVKS